MLNRACTPTPRIEDDGYLWYDRHADRCRLAQQCNHDLVLIGDSITHFWENSLAPRLYREVFGKYKTLNLGYGFDRTGNVLWRLDHGELYGQTPKLLMMNIGTNNFGKTLRYPGGDEPAEVADGIQAVTEKIHALSPGTVILLMGIFQRGVNRDGFRNRIRALNRILAERFENVPYVQWLDISEKFLLEDGSDLNTALFCDNCHPNEKGYQIWADAIAPYLDQYLNR